MTTEIVIDEMVILASRPGEAVPQESEQFTTNDYDKIDEEIDA